MKVLIVVDMQNDFIDGALGTKEAQSIVQNVKNKIKQSDNEYVIFTKDTHDDNYMDTLEGKLLPVKHCIRGTEGHKIRKELMSEYGNDVISKNTFGFESWKDILNVYQFDEIELCGLCTDICVVSNALTLRMFYPDTKIIVDASCCAGVTPYKHKCALEVMRSCQINVIGDENND